MKGRRLTKALHINNRILSIIVFSLFFSWMLAFAFQGQTLYSLANQFGLNPNQMVIASMAAHLGGLLSCSFLVKSIKAAKRLLIVSIIVCIGGSCVFLFPPSVLWMVTLILCGFLAGNCVAAWGFFFKYFTPQEDRIKTAADWLIYSNLLMIIINMVDLYLSPRIALGFSIVILLFALGFAIFLPQLMKEEDLKLSEKQKSPVSITKPLAFLCLFITVITINSGLMYQVVMPAYEKLEWLTSWYWAMPYIAFLVMMRNLPPKVNRTYILYIGIAMIGFSFIAFMNLGRSAGSYLVVNTLMLGAFGIYDLFWWSILGDLLDFHHNPAKILGVGLSANVLGVLLGSLIGCVLMSGQAHSSHTTMLALGVVCLTFVILPPLHKSLAALLKDQVYLKLFYEMPEAEQEEATEKFMEFANLSDRESQVASLLFEKKTYKMIAQELFISENTVKYYVKNIYSKFNVGSRGELISRILEKQNQSK